MKPNKILSSIALVASFVFLAGCETRDIHELTPLTRTPYQRTISDTTIVQKGDIQPQLNVNLSQNSLKYLNYTVDMENLEVESVNVSVGDYVKAGQVLVVFKSEKLQKEIEEKQEKLANDRMLLDYTKKELEILLNKEKEDNPNGEPIEEDKRDPRISIYEGRITDIEEDIKLRNVELAEKQREYNKCIITADEDGTITFVSTALNNGIVTPRKDLMTQVSGDVGFSAEINDDYVFEEGQVYHAVSQNMEFDVTVYKIETSQKGLPVVYFKPVNEDIVYIGNERFELHIEKELVKNIVYVDEKAVNTMEDGKTFVYVLNSEGFENPTYVEVSAYMEGMAVISKGLQGGEEVALK